MKKQYPALKKVNFLNLLGVHAGKSRSHMESQKENL